MNALSQQTPVPRCTIETLVHAGCESRGYSGFVQSFLPHAHAHYVIGVVRSGNRRLLCNGQEYELATGDVIAFNPGDVHGCVQDGESLFSYDSLAVPEALLDSHPLPGPVLAAPIAQTAYRRLSRNLRKAMAEDDARHALRAFRDDVSEGADLQLDSSRSGRNRTAALRVYAHLRGHLASPASIGTLAQHEGLSEYALIRAYKRVFCITPAQHLLSMRVDLARDLLACGMSPTAAAMEAGFSDQAHLTRAFKQRIGVTPAAYRLMAQGDDER